MYITHFSNQYKVHTYLISQVDTSNPAGTMRHYIPIHIYTSNINFALPFPQSSELLIKTGDLLI